MRRHISVLLGALALSTTLSVAKADGNKTISVLTIIETGKPAILVNLSDTSGDATIKGDSIVFDSGETSAKARITSANNVSPRGKKSWTPMTVLVANNIISSSTKGLTTTTIIRNNFEFVGKDKAGNPLLFKFKDGVAIITTTSIAAPPALAKPKA